MSIRGAIELVLNDLVAGWISSTTRDLRDARVLAFLGTDCIGAGNISIHRPDIEAVGFGNGWAGFAVPTGQVPDARLNEVYVKLEGEDLILVRPEFHQRPAAAAPPPPAAHAASSPDEQERTVRWMRERGWLGPAEAEVLRRSLRFGACEMRVAAGEASPIERARTTLADLLAPLERRDVTVESMFCRDSEALAAALQAQRDEHPERPVALWSVERSQVAVAEGSHLATQEDGQLGGVTYPFGGGTILVLHPLVTVIPPETLGQTLLLRAAG